MFGLAMGRMGSVGGQMTDLQRILMLPGMGPLWDFSDTSTMFQDSASTQPVTAYGQPVGLVLDKSKGLVRGPNLTPGGGTFDSSAGWSLAAGWVVADGVATFAVADGANRDVIASDACVIGRTYEFSADVQCLTGAWRFYLGATYGGVVSKSGRVTVIATAALGTSPLLTALAGFTGSIDNFTVRELPGAHLIQPTAINRPIYALDANGKPSLSFNGTNQWLQTASNLDLSGTNKLTVVAGFYRIGGGATGTLFEHSTNMNNFDAFAVFAPISGTAVTAVTHSNSGGAFNSIQVNEPASSASVYTWQLDRAQPSSEWSARRNAVMPTVARLQDGNTVGGLTNQPFFIGARAGTSLFFNGNIHTLAIRGALSTQPEIDLLERFANSRAGAF